MRATADTVRFAVGDLVRHRADGCKGVVTSVIFKQSGVQYQVASSMTATTVCEECELVCDEGRPE